MEGTISNTLILIAFTVRSRLKGLPEPVATTGAAAIRHPFDGNAPVIDPGHCIAS